MVKVHYWTPLDPVSLCGSVVAGELRRNHDPAATTWALVGGAGRGLRLSRERLRLWRGVSEEVDPLAVKATRVELPDLGNESRDALIVVSRLAREVVSAARRNRDS